MYFDRQRPAQVHMGTGRKASRVLLVGNMRGQTDITRDDK